MSQKREKAKKAPKFLAGVLVLVILIVAFLVVLIQVIRPENTRANNFAASSDYLLYNQADFSGMQRQDLKAIIKHGRDMDPSEQSATLKQNMKNAQDKLSVYRNPGQKADRKAYRKLSRSHSGKDLKKYQVLLNYSFIGKNNNTSPAIRPVPGSFRDRGKYTTFMGKVYTGVSVGSHAVEKLEPGDKLRLPVGKDGKKVTFHVDHGLVLTSDDNKFQGSSLKLLDDGRYYLFLKDGSRYNVYSDKVRFYVLKGAQIGTDNESQTVDATTLNLLSAKELGSYNEVIFDRKGYVTGIYNFKA